MFVAALIVIFMGVGMGLGLWGLGWVTIRIERHWPGDEM